MKFRPLYLLAIVASLSVWFFPYYSPLWLDETVSYWEINSGLGQIWSRSISGLSFPPYFYALWIMRELFGSREVVLRIPSVLAMLAAVYVLYSIAREFVDQDVAFIVCILFCMHKDVAFAAIDVRPYAFAVLTANLAIYALLVWLRKPGDAHSLLLGAFCGLIFYFHYLYAVILPAFVTCYFLARGRSLKADHRQIGVVLAAFLAVFAPVLPRLLYILTRRNSYSFADPPTLKDLALAFVPTAFLFHKILLFTVLAALLLALVYSLLRAWEEESTFTLLCASTLAMVPMVLLFAVSVSTPMRVFVDRYCLVGVAGVVLLWGFLISLIRPVQLRLLVPFVLVPYVIFSFWNSPQAHRHGYTWKYALEYAQFIAQPDNASLVICSDLPQADFEPMPAGPASESVLFSPLSYYQVTVPVVPVPRTLTPDAKRIATKTLEESLRNNQRFLLLAFRPSYPTMQWFIDHAVGAFAIKLLADFEGIAVVEFQPLQPAPG